MKFNTLRDIRAFHLSRQQIFRIGAIAICALTLTGLGWLWLRDSSLVSVKEVRITGVHSSQAPAIRSALTSEAKEMTTLHIREDALKQSVRRFPSVSSLRVETAIPHRLAIKVVEHEPVALMVSNSKRVPVTGSGLILHGVPPKGQLPEIHSKAPVGGKLIKGTRERAILATLAAAPNGLRPRIHHAWFDARGLTIQMRSGPQLLFGSAARIHSKWDSATKVMADRTSSAASYIDVRLPERVAVGGVMTETEIAAEQAKSNPENLAIQPPAQPSNEVQTAPQPSQNINP